MRFRWKVLLSILLTSSAAARLIYLEPAEAQELAYIRSASERHNLDSWLRGMLGSSTGEKCVMRPCPATSPSMSMSIGMIGLDLPRFSGRSLVSG
jgi:hypothetical protein